MVYCICLSCHTVTEDSKPTHRKFCRKGDSHGTFLNVPGIGRIIWIMLRNVFLSLWKLFLRRGGQLICPPPPPLVLAKGQQHWVRQKWDCAEMLRSLPTCTLQTCWNFIGTFVTLCWGNSKFRTPNRRCVSTMTPGTEGCTSNVLCNKWSLGLLSEFGNGARRYSNCQIAWEQI